MYLGQIVERSDTRELFANPLHPYAQALLSAIPHPTIHNKKEPIILEGELPAPSTLWLAAVLHHGAPTLLTSVFKQNRKWQSLAARITS